MELTPLYKCNAEYTEIETGPDGKIRQVKKTCDVVAKDAHVDIALDEIMEIAEQITAIAEALVGIDLAIKDHAESLTKDYLSVNGVGIENLWDDCHSDVNANIGKIKDSANEISNQAVAYFNKMQEIYNRNARAICTGRRH